MNDGGFCSQKIILIEGFLCYRQRIKIFQCIFSYNVLGFTFSWEKILDSLFACDPDLMGP